MSPVASACRAASAPFARRRPCIDSSPAAPSGRRADELGLLEDVAAVMRDASICGLGQTAASAVQSAIATFGLFGSEEGP